jgi:uncharacterized membrane protein
MDPEPERAEGDDPARATSEATRGDIEAILRLEKEARRGITRSERIGLAAVRQVGRLGFLIAHVFVMAAWVGINVGLIPGIRPFDPFPFGILTMIVSAEGVLLALFILISQNVFDREADRREHLALQISLLSERETTKSLQILRSLARRLGAAEVDEDARTTTLSSETHLETLAKEVAETLEREMDR